MNFLFAKHMAIACSNMGYTPVLLSPHGHLDTDPFRDCWEAAVLIRGEVEDEVSMKLFASAAHNAKLVGDNQCIPKKVDGKLVEVGFILI